MRVPVEKVKRWVGLDILKCICAFLVIYIHTPIPGRVGDMILALSQIAVPVFFMISGFFYRKVQEDGRTAMQMKKIAILLAISLVLYGVWDLLAAVRLHIPLGEWLTGRFQPKAILIMLLFNEALFGYHIWYLGAILYVLFLYTKVGLHKVKGLVWVIPLLLAGNLLVGRYGFVLFADGFPGYLERNWLLLGLPFFALGRFLFDKIDVLRAKISRVMLIACVLLFFATSLLEDYLLRDIAAIFPGDMYISTIFLAMAVFLLFALFVGSGGSRATACLVGIGRKHSTWIYILHLLVISVIREVMDAVFHRIYHGWLLFLTILCTLGMVLIGSRVVRRK
ncbi:MAG: acyltransferase [Lachnospiraceae bacterium]|nr:acyltransferase [Lachnospiraceae bacterium]